ncbi:cation diffusion facilitator family transporter [Flavisolibacter tropicus]|uniref:Cation transporter n=1 Tax=Flavisolibacter tropicus TaxID=1492898 RepID=A0A172TYH7_9BACT|nr:cation diffusion facilitator family transporter [Flavisolibacter tropicus]ANE52135.1 cation transporter [Flavisolibacter tropicus]
MSTGNHQIEEANEHSHQHAHGHSHAVAINKENKNVFLIGIGLNLAFVLAEAIAGIAYNSMALLTDAGHNLSDVASLVVSLVAFWIAKRPSNAVYTYGFKKTTVLAALANAVTLLVAVGVLGFESFTRLLHPEVVSGGVIAWVAALGILINGITAFLFFKQKHELNSKAAYLHLLADALVSLGVVIAGVVISYTQLYWLDPAIGIVIMIVILVSTWGLLRDSFKMTIDAVPEGIELDAIKKIITSVPYVKQVQHVHVWSLSTTENALTAHVVIDEQLSFDQKLDVIANIKHELEHHDIHHSTIELEKTSH